MIKCNKNPNHKVVKYQYISFSYHYCKHCKKEVVSEEFKNLNEEAYQFELEFNNNLLLNLPPNHFFPEYFMVEKEDNYFILIPIDRISQQKIKYSEISKVTINPMNEIISNYRQKGIKIKFQS